MGIATSTVASIVNTGFAVGAQEARKDAIARNTIPQINQNSQSKNSNAFSQTQSQLSPERSALYVQSDAINKAVSEKEQQKHKEDRLKNDEKEGREAKVHSSEGESTAQEPQASSASYSAAVSTAVSATGSSLDSEVTQAGVIHEAASAVLGAAYSEDADEKREKGSGFTSKVVAEAYNAIVPKDALGKNVNVHS